jgi:SCF-associated factor 1
MLADMQAFHHTAPQLTGPTQTGAASPTRGPYILQVEAGWNHSACLTAKGDIHVWRPFSFVSPPIPETDTSDDDDQYVDPNPPPAVEPTEPGSKLHGPLKTPEGRRFYWGTYPKDMVSTLLPIPERPAPPSDDAALVAVEKEFAQAAANASFSRMNEDQQREFTRAVKIACTEHGVLALRANGEVWLLSDIDSGDWQFVSKRFFVA